MSGVRSRVTGVRSCVLARRSLTRVRRRRCVCSERRDWSALNLPPVDRPRQLTALRLCSEARGLLARLTRALADFYSYSEQRCKAFAASGVSPRLSDVNSKVGGAPPRPATPRYTPPRPAAPRRAPPQSHHHDDHSAPGRCFEQNIKFPK